MALSRMNETFNFLMLPTESRQNVFRHLFRDVEISIACPDPRTCCRPRDIVYQPMNGARAHPILNITLVSRRIRQEAMAQFLKHAIFQFTSLHAGTAVNFGTPYTTPFINNLSKIHRVDCITFSGDIAARNMEVKWLRGNDFRLSFVFGLYQFTNQCLKELRMPVTMRAGGDIKSLRCRFHLSGYQYGWTRITYDIRRMVQNAPWIHLRLTLMLARHLYAIHPLYATFDIHNKQVAIQDVCEHAGFLLSACDFIEEIGVEDLEVVHDLRTKALLASAQAKN